MRVRVDQAGDDRLARGVNDLIGPDQQPCRRRAGLDCLDAFSAYEDVAGLQRLPHVGVAGEHPAVVNQKCCHFSLPSSGLYVSAMPPSTWRMLPVK